jgi:hypothetical protein
MHACMYVSMHLCMQMHSASQGRPVRTSGSNLVAQKKVPGLPIRTSGSPSHRFGLLPVRTVLVGRFAGSPGRRFAGSLVRGFAGSSVRRFTGPPVPRLTDSMLIWIIWGCFSQHRLRHFLLELATPLINCGPIICS